MVKISGPLSVTSGKRVVIVPMLEEGVPPVLCISPHTLLIRAYSLSETGRSKHQQVPARNIRALHTKLRGNFPEDVMPMLSSHSFLAEHMLEAHRIQIDPETGEIMITVVSFRHDSFLIPHEAPLAYLHFISMVEIDLEN